MAGVIYKQQHTIQPEALSDLMHLDMSGGVFSIHYFAKMSEGKAPV